MDAEQLREKLESLVVKMPWGEVQQVYRDAGWKWNTYGGIGCEPYIPTVEHLKGAAHLYQLRSVFPGMQRNKAERFWKRLVGSHLRWSAMAWANGQVPARAVLKYCLKDSPRYKNAL